MKRVPLLFLLLALAPVHAEEREDDRARLAFLKRIETKAEAVHEVADNGGAERALAVYEKHKGNLDSAAMAKIYKAAGTGPAAFKNVAYLIGADKISDADSIAMAQIREAMIEDLIMEIGKEKGLRIARSDSGNVNSGMKSDLDQTFYVFEGEHGDDGWKFDRKPELDGPFIAEFNKRWQQRYGESGLSLGALDIASIEGRNRFPDVRITEAAGFWLENRRTHEALRNTPGAYTYGGAVGHQMQFRALQAILDGNVRAYQVYEPKNKGDAQSGWQQNKASSDEAIKTMFGKAPELRPAWAFDAALANFLELQHYMGENKFETKYHLRTFEDAALSKWLADQGMDRTGKQELVDLELPDRNKFYDTVLPRVFPGDTPEAQTQRRMHRLALEVSVAQRLQHKGQLHRIEAFKGNPPADAVEQRRLIFDEYGKAKYGDRWTSGMMNANVHGLVDISFRRLASEFCLESAYHTSKEAFALLLDQKAGKHLDLDRYRSLLNIESDAEWKRTQKNLRQAAHLTFLYGIYDLGLAKSTVLANRLRQEFGTRYTFDLLWLWTQGRVQGLAGPISQKGVRGVYREFMDQKLPEISERVQDHVLAELGLEYKAAIDQVDAKLKQHHLVWDPGKFAGNMVYDPGNLDAIAQVVRVFVESKGDWEKTQQAIAMEFLMAVPVLGQVIGAGRGGVTGLAAMGVAMAYPPVGLVLVAIGVGEAGYAIYEVEKAAPERANAVNAVYRGFAGPELAHFGSAPPQFTDDDEKSLAAMKKQLGDAVPKTGHIRVYDAEAVRQLTEMMRVKIAEYHRLKKELPPKIQALEQKKALWEAYRDDPAYGGYFSGAGARTMQSPFENFLLEGLDLFVGFSPGGLIDFRARQDEAGIDALWRRVENAPDFETLLRAEAEHNEARLQRARQERAERYLERANGRADEKKGLTQREMRMGLPELRHQLRRDSLYPALKAKGIDDPDKFVDEFFRNNATVLWELLRKGLVAPDSGLVWEPAFPQPRPRYTKLSAFPEVHMKRLKAVVRADLERSKLLWEHFQEREKIRKLKAKQDLGRRLEAFEAAAAGEAVTRLRTNKKLLQLYAAMREGVRPPTPPALQATVFRRPKSKETDRKLGDEAWGVETRLRADPAVFPPPYATKLWALSPEDAKTAVASASHKGIPLFPGTVRELRGALTSQTPPRSGEDDRLFFLVTVSCAKVDVRLVDGVPEKDGKSVIGQFVSWGRKERERKETPKPTAEKLWFIFEYIGHPDDDARVFRKLGARFPELRGYRPPWTHKPTDRTVVTLSVRPCFISLDRIQGEIDRNRKGGRPAGANIKPTLHHGMAYGKVTCGGQTRFGYFRYQMFGGKTLGNTGICGLKDGVHPVTAEGMLPDGTRFKDSYRIVVQRKPRERKKLDRAERSLAYARELLAKKNDYKSRRRLGAALKDYVRYYLEEGEGKPSVLDTHLKEAANIVPGVIAEEARTRKPSSFWHTNSSRLRSYITLCRHVNSMQAYKTLSVVLKAMEPHLPGDRKPPYQLWSAHRTLGDILVGQTGKLGPARKHYEAAMAWERRGGREPEPLKWWPTNYFKTPR